MRRSILIASGTALILGLLGLAMFFGPALAQQVVQANGAPQVAEADAVGSCHDGGDMTGSAKGHMLGPLAKALGMSEAELGADLDAGKSVKDIAKARGYDDTKLAAALNGAMQDSMQQHVQDGLFSQTQADEMLKHMDQMGPTHLTDMLDGQMSTDMMGRQDHGGMMSGQDHGAMMGGESHESMMGGQQPQGMMDDSTGDDGQGSSCHADNIPAGQQL